MFEDSLVVVDIGGRGHVLGASVPGNAGIANKLANCPFSVVNSSFWTFPEITCFIGFIILRVV